MSTRGDGLKAACITVLGSGYAPFASGTWGSGTATLIFLPLWFGIALSGGPRWGVEVGIVIGILLASWISVLWGEWAVAKFGRKDPKQFVLDEFGGQWVAFLALPMTLSAGWPAVAVVLFGQFFLFRAFDVWKPWPARQLEALPAGWGILLDDLFAGLYANIVGQLIWRLTPLAVWLHLGIAG